jgi:hypothetical protein
VSEMIERAAKAVCAEALVLSSKEQSYPTREDLEANVYVPIARAALSAALDEEDEKLVEAIARATSLCGRDWDTPFDFDTAPDYAKDAKRDEARAALAALKAHDLGENKP